jgi:predicted transcriptional regulator of viral defense system
MISIKPDIKELFIRNKGYSTLKELVKRKVHTSYIKTLLDEKLIEKVKPGLYKLIDYEYDNLSSYIDICKANTDAVICNITALTYHELTTQNSYLIDVAIPNSRKPNKIIYPPVKYHYFRITTYQLGIDEIKTRLGSFRIYDKEKTICDIFRNRRFYGEEIILECLKEYLKTKNKKINKLYEYAKICRIDKIIFQYVKIMSG